MPDASYPNTVARPFLSVSAFARTGGATRPVEAEHWETAYRGFNPDDVPHLLIQLQDDLSRARKREAAWLSIILHLFLVILLWNSEKLVNLLPHRTVPLELRADMDRDKDATFLELPPDEQKLTRRPDTKVLSDKDRVATTKAPQINREELRKLLQSTWRNARCRRPARSAATADRTESARTTTITTTVAAAAKSPAGCGNLPASK